MTRVRVTRSLRSVDLAGTAEPLARVIPLPRVIPMPGLYADLLVTTPDDPDPDPDAA